MNVWSIEFCSVEHNCVADGSVADVFFFKQKTAYEVRISDWSSDVCSSDLDGALQAAFKTAFADRIRDDEVDGAAVKIDKSLTVDERRLLVAETKQMLERYRVEEGLESLSDAELRAHCLANEVGIFIAMLNKMNDDELRAVDPLLPQGWFRYPYNTMAEPPKDREGVGEGKRVKVRVD